MGGAEAGDCFFLIWKVSLLRAEKRFGDQVRTVSFARKSVSATKREKALRRPREGCGWADLGRRLGQRVGGHGWLVFVMSGYWVKKGRKGRTAEGRK